MSEEGGGTAGKDVRRNDSSSSRPHPYRKEPPPKPAPEEKKEHKLYIGNLDHRCTEYHVLKMFTTFGKIKREEYMWHTHGPKRGEPRGFAFVEYSKRQEAEAAKEKMNGRMAFGRPLVVRFVDEKVVTHNSDAPVRAPAGRDEAFPTPTAIPATASKNAKIIAIQNKLKAMEKESQGGKH